MLDFNGRSFFLEDRWHSSKTLRLFTDAAGSFGFGAIFGDRWCYGEWPSNCKGKNIAILEFYAIVLSLHFWGAFMKNRLTLFYTDNEALVHVINKNTCKNKVLMIFVRLLVLICLKRNIYFRAKHVLHVFKELADSLSRLQVQKFRRLAPQVRAYPTPIPLNLQPQNWQV